MKTIVFKYQIEVGVKTLLTRFLKNTGIAPEELLAYMRRLANAKRSAMMLLGFLAFLIGTNRFFAYEGWNQDEYGFAIQLWTFEALLFMISFLVVAFQLANVMLGDRSDEFGPEAKRFKQARRAFKKHFGRDVLECESASILEWQIVGHTLHAKAAQVKALNGKSGQWEKQQELRKMWDTGNAFVDVPTYDYLFKA